MNFSDKIIVIGDSHVRAFSYVDVFIPLFIGPAAFNNYLTQVNAERNCKKILELFSDKNSYGRILLLFSGDVEHVVRKSSGENDSEYNLLNESALRYAECIKIIHNNLPNVSILISAVLPGRSLLYKKYQDYYNSVLLNFIKKLPVTFLDINARITTSDGILAAHYKADFAHISYYAVDYFIKQLIDLAILKANNYFHDYLWAYIYNIETQYGPFKIWGNIYKDQLIVEYPEVLPLAKFQVKSSLRIVQLKRVFDYCNQILKIRQYTIANCREGFLAFELEKIVNVPTVRIDAFDFNLKKIENAQTLKGLIKNCAVQFYQIISPGFKIQPTGAVVDFEQHKFNDETRIQLLVEYSKSSEYIYIISENITSDLRLFAKTGYKNCGILLSNGGEQIIVASNSALYNISNLFQPNSFNTYILDLKRFLKRYLS